jgi:DNA-directed RNA polymerase specialized sigma subunit
VPNPLQEVSPRLAKLEQAIAALDTRSRTVIELFLDALSMQTSAIKQIAAHYQCSRSTAYRYLHRAIDELRDYILSLEDDWGERFPNIP